MYYSIHKHILSSVYTSSSLFNGYFFKHGKFISFLMCDNFALVWDAGILCPETLISIDIIWNEILA
jgi:hypothetical protein